MADLQKRLLLAIALLLAVTTIAVLFKYAVFVNGAGRFSGDFMSFWEAAERLRAGDIAGIYDPERWRAVVASGKRLDLFWYVYPPYSLLGLWPLGSLSFTGAALTWLLAPIPFCAALITLLVRRSLHSQSGASRIDRAPPLQLITIVALAYALPLLAFHIVAAQTGAVMAVLFMSAALCWRDRPIVTGVLIGLMSIKPQMGLLIPIALVAAGRWQTIASAVATIGVLAASVTLWLGGSIWYDYFAMTQIFASFLAGGHEGIPHLAAAPYVSLIAIGAPDLLASVVAGICLMSAVVFVFNAFRARSGDGRDDLRLAILVSATPLATPYALSYDLPILILAAVPIIVRVWLGRMNVVAVVVLAAVVAAPAGQLAFVHVGIPFGLLALAAWVAVLLHCYQQEGTQAVSGTACGTFGNALSAQAATH